MSAKVKSSFTNSRLNPITFGDRAVSIPSLYVSPSGTVSVLLRDEVIIEMTVGGNVRVVVNEKFSAAVTKDSSAASIMHPQTRIFQENQKFYCQFGELFDAKN